MLAKPNVIFGLDDSGSMDWRAAALQQRRRVLVGPEQQQRLGHRPAHPNPSLRPLTTTWFNNVGNADSRWQKMIYLFPNGSEPARASTATSTTTTRSCRRRSSPSCAGPASGATAPRYRRLDPLSAAAQPVNYNPLGACAPWAPAQLSSGAMNPLNASTTGAPSRTRSTAARRQPDVDAPVGRPATTILHRDHGMRVLGRAA